MRPDCGLSRNCNSQPVVRLIVWKNKGGNQGAVVASTVLVHLFELAATTQVIFHWLLVMRRSEPLAALGAAPLQHQSPIFRSHSRTKAMRLRSAPVVGLEGPFGHCSRILPSNETIRLNASSTCVKKRARVYESSVVRLRRPVCASYIDGLARKTLVR